MNVYRLLFLTITVCLAALHATGQVARMPEMGRPMSSYFSSAEYRAHDQNFAVTQDASGVMYFANFAGVLEYDGVSWRTIPTDNVARVSALAIDSRGRVLVGANGEFGYLAADSTGAHRFQSLSANLKQRPTGILLISPVKNGAWFLTENTHFFWDGKVVRPVARNLSIQSAFVFQDKIVAYSKTRGIVMLQNGQPVELAAADDVPALLDLAGVVPIDTDNAILFTNGQGAYALHGNTIRNLGGNARSVLSAGKVSAAGPMQNGDLLVALGNGNLVVLSPDGDLRYPVSIPELREAQVNAVFRDRDSNIWLALNDGIGHLDIPSPVSVFDHADGLKGALTFIVRFQGKLFAGTLYGLFEIQNNRAVRVPGSDGGCLGATVADGSLYVASSKGLFQWSGSGGLTRLNATFSLAVTASASGQMLLVGLQDGLAVLEKSGTGWNTRRVKGIDMQIVGATEYPAGVFWLETLSNGVLRYVPATGAIKAYSAAQGISSPLYNKFSVHDNRLIVSNKDGLFEYDNDRFKRASWLHGDKTWFDRVQSDAAGNLWTTRGDRKSVSFFQKSAQGYRLVDRPFAPVAEVPFQVIFPDQDGVAWLGGDQGLYRLDLTRRYADSTRHTVLLRNVSVQNRPLAPGSGVGGARAAFGYRDNTVAFEYALPSFFGGQETVYQYLLENYEAGWSDWGAQTRKEYSGLPSGRYVFHVRARDVYGNVSQEASFAFSIATPWFRQWYMVALYAIAFGVMIYYAVRWRLRAVIREKADLETRIQERTEEVVYQKEELEQQSEELAATNDQLERIDEFVKAINSEVNTEKLFQLVLDRLCQFQNVDGASALVYSKAGDNYQFIALSGSVANADVEDLRLSASQAHERYVANAEEVYEDIYLQNTFRRQTTDHSVDEIFSPQSLITIVIRVEGDVKSYITMENMTREHAFAERDFNMVRNLKEHLIAAYIKTDILENLENTLTNLKSAQEELIRQERLASVGSLTKGIVDRILNPLNYINNFSQSSGKLLKEITEVTDKHQDVLTEDERDDLDSGLDMLQKNLEKIFEHGNSTTRIVKDMQKLLKGKSTEFFVTELNPFLESKARSAIQEVLNEYKGASVKLTFALDSGPVKVSLLPYEFAQVLTNLISNACYALIEKAKLDKAFTPELIVSSRLASGGVRIGIRDNGKGIPPKEAEQLFNPFFTTKPTSKGTGLGLYMSKDIIEYHKGRIQMDSKEGEFTEVGIFLPVAPDQTAQLTHNAK